MSKELMALFVEYMEKQETLSKLTGKEKLNGYNYSEIHTIDAIGELTDPNVTQIANHMNLTRGAISKITKRLIEEDLVESYRQSGNKQKIFFRLTSSGKCLYSEHKERHKLWQERDEAFIDGFDSETIERVEEFMMSFNEYLELQIKALEEGINEN